MKVRLLQTILLFVVVSAGAVACGGSSVNNTNSMNSTSTSNATTNSMTGVELLTKTENLSINSMQMDMAAKMDFESNGMTMNMTMNTSEGQNISNHQGYMMQTMTSSWAPSWNYSEYAYNGWLYVSDSDMEQKWIKTTLTDDIWSKEFGNETSLGLSRRFIDAKYLGIENVGGINCYKIDLTPDLVALESDTGIAANLVGNTSLAEVFNDTTCTMWIAENTYYPIKIIMDMKAHKVEFASAPANMSMYMTITYSKINEPINITLPAAAQEPTPISHDTFMSGQWKELYELALNPNAYSYFNQTWEGQTINLPLDVASTLKLTDANDTGWNIKYPNGSDVVIKNRKNTHDPTMAELKAFLKADRTNALVYVNQSFVCSNFAVTLHDNAEANGIRCAFVDVGFNGSCLGHAFNAFQTTDDGLVFVDDTGTSEGNGKDYFAKIRIGYPISEVSVFKSDSSHPFNLRGNVSFGVIYW